MCLCSKSVYYVYISKVKNEEFAEVFEKEKCNNAKRICIKCILAPAAVDSEWCKL